MTIEFKYGCFISYKRGKHDLIQTFIDDIRNALEAYLEPWMQDAVEELVYIDEDGIGYGDDISRNLADALCHSVCMVMIYTPEYFSKKKPWCTREYRAMKSLETRLKKGSAHGLVIPIILRGIDNLPTVLKDTKYLNFADFKLGEPSIATHPKYRDEIDKVSEQVFHIFKSLQEAEDNCEAFALSSVEEVCQWLDENNVLAPDQKFPGRP